jgi:hypothetical protein
LFNTFATCTVCVVGITVSIKTIEQRNSCSYDALGLDDVLSEGSYIVRKLVVLFCVAQLSPPLCKPSESCCIHSRFGVSRAPNVLSSPSARASSTTSQGVHVQSVSRLD